MAFALEPVVGDSLWVNAWNWHPTIELLVRAGVFTSERADPLHYNCGGDVTEVEAVKVGEFLTWYLASIAAGNRLLIDGTVTSETDTGELFRGSDWQKNYSVTKEWLEKFRDFCMSCQGFSVL